MNIILLVIDSLRPDHLSITGYPRDTSPNIDRLIAEGTYFSNAFTVLPNTNPTFASILTGMYPHSHKIRMMFHNQLKPGLSTLQGILKSHNYNTAYTKSGIHFGDGTEKNFDFCDPLTSKLKNKMKRVQYKLLHPNTYLGMAEQQFNTAISWIKKNLNKKFFLMLHTNDLHWPYLVPKPYQEMFDPMYKGNHDFATLSEGKISRGDLIFGHKKLPEDEIKHAIAHYDGGIKYIDEQVGKLVKFLEMCNLEQETILILTADHGENFGEHGYYFQHGEHLYNQCLKIPLIIKNPKLIPKNKKINSLVQILDLMPTILELVHIPLVDKLDGISLVPLINGQPSKLREFAFAESVENYFNGNKKIFFKGVKGKWRMMISGKWKIILIPHPENNIFELYDLESDPDEKNNLIDQNKEIAGEMKKKILNFLKPQENEGIRDPGSLEERSKKVLIRAGYIEE
jgi:arylsulfatase A-like enzyme